MLRYKIKARRARRAQEQALAQRCDSDAGRAADWRFCYEYLTMVSRSFALVILELEQPLRDAVCVFYLTLRALDTIEDDTGVDAHQRMQLCRQFYHHLDDAEYSVDGYGHAHERELLLQFTRVLHCYHELDAAFQEIITDITRRMGEGMALHIHDTANESVAQYDTYCHYVAGLVGIGLSAMFVEAGFEARELFTDSKAADALSNSMGLFLQKTNIIRDYLEDAEEGRTFWPREVWSRFGGVQQLEELALPQHRRPAVECLNAMVTDALRHAPDCIAYISRVRTDSVFNFVAIPQVMAVATLALCYNNPRLFQERLKLRRGLTAKLVLRARDLSGVMHTFAQYADDIACRADPCDPSYAETIAAVERVFAALARAECEMRATTAKAEAAAALITDANPTTTMTTTTLARPPLNLRHANRIAVMLFVVLSWYVLYRRKQQDGGGLGWRAAFGGIPSVGDMAAIGLLFAVLSYLLGVFGLQYVTLAPPSRSKVD